MGDTERKPKAAFNPPSRQIKSEDPGKFDAETIAWQFFRLDWQHEHWGFNQLGPTHWRDLRDSLAHIEGLTWSELKQTFGGRGAGGGTNHHSLPTSELSSRAQKRLEELSLDDCDDVFSLRLNNTLRIYGIRDGRVFQILWYDRHHGSKNGVFLTKNVR
jgi:hypothetical protein